MELLVVPIDTAFPGEERRTRQCCSRHAVPIKSSFHYGHAFSPGYSHWQTNSLPAFGQKPIEAQFQQGKKSYKYICLHLKLSIFYLTYLKKNVISE
jgi:hypothetical protein